MRGFYTVTCIDANGNTKWSEVAENALYNEGEFGILDIAFRGGSAPAAWYIGLLFNTLSVAPAETTILSTIPVSTHEPESTGSAGYTARQTIARDATASGWPTLALDSGDFLLTSRTVSWTASGNWPNPVRWIFLTTAATPRETTGKLYSIAQLQADRTVLSGDTINVTYSIKLQ